MISWKSEQEWLQWLPFDTTRHSKLWSQITLTLDSHIAWDLISLSFLHSLDLRCFWTKQPSTVFSLQFICFSSSGWYLSVLFPSFIVFDLRHGNSAHSSEPIAHVDFSALPDTGETASRCRRHCCFKVLFIWKFILRSSPQEYLFFLCDMSTVVGLDRARQKCPSELGLQAQLLLVQPTRRSPLSSTGWKPESQLCNLSGREDSSLPLRHSSCWLSFFGKWRDCFARWCVLWNYCPDTDLAVCMGEQNNRHPCVVKNGWNDMQKWEVP